MTKPPNFQESIMPILPLRDVVVYPGMVIPLFVGRQKSVRALKAAMDLNKQVLLVAQRDASQENPTMDDFFPVGAVATILQLLELPDGTIKVLVEGNKRAVIDEILQTEEYFQASVVFIEEEPPADLSQAELLMRSVMTQF